MATSADHDDHDEKDEKDEAAEGEESAEEKGDKAVKARAKDEGGKQKLPAKAKAAAEEKAADDEDEADGHDDEGEADEEEEKPAPRPKAAAKRPGGGRGPGAARAARKAAPPPQGGGSLGKSVLLFFVIVIGLGVGFAVLGREQPQQAARPKWKSGDNTEVEITLVHTDRADLACASTEELAGKHCAFEAPNKPSSKGSADDKTLFKPYTTVDNMQFAAAGLWSEPILAPGKVPTVGRFSVKCKYKIDGTLKTLGVRWHDGEQFFPNTEWFAGSVSDCKISPP